MNKKFLSAILFGALMVTSTGTFVSCKDYDEDIDSINKELTDIKSQLAALQAKVDAGKWITSANSTAEGVTITLSDGSTLKITNGKDGKDGAQGAAGQNGADGKNGTVVTVNENGVLCLDGVETAIKVAEEAPAALPCVKVEAGELMVLQADGTYAASGIKAGSVTAAKVNGMWTITVDGETITVPGSAALTSIEIHDEYGDKDFSFYYGVLNKAKAWGWDEEESMEAGFYTKLDRDMIVLLNPAEADGTAFDYTFRNSLGAAADVKFFEDAKPYEGALYSYSRAASNNGLWVLPAAVTKKPASEIETLRRELYLNFKGNDASAYALTLEAVDGMGNVAVRSDYDYTIALEKAGNYQRLNSEYYNLIGKAYYPTLYGAVYDYKIRVNKSAENLRWAKVFGVELTADEKGYIAKNESAVYNGIEFDVTGILINGETFTSSFTVYFTNEMTTGNAMQVDALKDALDATWNKNGYFEYTYKYDLSDYVAELSDDAKLLWDQQIADGSYKSKWESNAELIGGEVVENGKDYNEDNINWALINNISWSISGRTAKEPNILTYTFRVNKDYYRNFQLNTAYQLSFDIIDPLNETVKVATITLPFEFTQPTLDINQVPGEFTEWGTIDLLKQDKNNKYYISTERALYVYGPKSIVNNWDDMFLPLYDSFTAWKAKSATVAEYSEYVDNAKYYELNVMGINGGRVLSANDAQAHGTWYEKTLYNDLMYTAVFTQLNTWMQQSYIKAAATNGTEGGTQVLTTFAKDGKTPIAKPYELSTPVEVSYYHYGVYPAENTLDTNADGDVVNYNGKVESTGDDFNLVFASWLNHSTLGMKETSYSTERGSHIVYLTNDDLNFTTPKGDAFYLFDDISATGAVVKRADKNTSFNEIQQHPFTTVSELFVDANFSAKQAAGSQEPVTVKVSTEDIAGDWFVLNPLTGVSTLNVDKFEAAADADKVQVYNVPSYPLTKVSTDQVVSGVAQAFQGGMVIQLPKSIQDGQSVIVTVTIADKWGYKKSVDITVKKL